MQKLLKSFDLILDVKEKEDRTTCFQKLIKQVNSKLRGVKHRPGTLATRNILKMFKTVKEDSSYLDLIRVSSTDLENELIQGGWCRERSNNEYNLMRDFEKIVELLASFYEEPKEPKYEIEVIVELPKPKKLRKVTVYDKITILERWVKIGYQMYRRQVDAWTGDEYIIVDGDVYEIKSDRYGREYLV
jgi:hypothetical protein